MHYCSPHIIFPAPQTGALLTFYREDSQVINPARRNDQCPSQAAVWGGWLCCCCSEFTGGSRPLSGLGAQGPQGWPQSYVMSAFSSGSTVSWGHFKSHYSRVFFSYSDISNFGFYSSKHFSSSLCLLPAWPSAPNIFPSPDLYKQPLNLSFLGAEEFFLPNPYTIFIYLLTVLRRCLLLLVMKETGCSAFLCFPQF